MCHGSKRCLKKFLVERVAVGILPKTLHVPLSTVGTHPSRIDHPFSDVHTSSDGRHYLRRQLPRSHTDVFEIKLVRPQKTSCRTVGSVHMSSALFGACWKAAHDS